MTTKNDSNRDALQQIFRAASLPFISAPAGRRHRAASGMARGSRLPARGWKIWNQLSTRIPKWPQPDRWVAQATGLCRAATRRSKGVGRPDFFVRRFRIAISFPFRPASGRTAQAGRLFYPVLLRRSGQIICPAAASRSRGRSSSRKTGTASLKPPADGRGGRSRVRPSCKCEARRGHGPP